MPSLLSIEKLSRNYGNLCAVDSITFELAKGDILGFLGPNGAGKTTTMDMLTGNLAPSAGRVTVNGIDLLDEPRDAKRHIGYLPEQPPVYRDLTVDEYLAFCAHLNGIIKQGRTKAINTVKERTGLTKVGHRLIGNLSKGFQQRAGIAQAIIHMPDIVIMDEPTIGLDPLQIREIRLLIRELGQTHGVILSTHILPEVQATCSRVQIIHQGRLVFADTIAGLEQRLCADSLILGLKKPPPKAFISNIQGVQTVEALPDSRFRLHFAVGHNPAEQVLNHACEHGWGPYECRLEQHTLEQIFIDLTCRDQASQATEETD
ncbi:MAG: gliding motility-associated ABC transporter ATP-binding subunit GldA [Gammaproteobacteria bacterium]|nr:MAG: gliding motility-associated ABC transporter ATP-binding subunit GldA [Gammaproteobacteria bacterium]